MSKTEAKRPARVGERIREELMALLVRGEVKDPAVRDAHVSGVDVSPDLRHARVFVRTMAGAAEPETQKSLLRGLARASGFLRREVGASLGLRHVPELRFVWDDTAERAARLDDLLAEIRREDQEK